MNNSPVVRPPRKCYFCNCPGELKRQQFYVKVAGKNVLERHYVCSDCQEKHLKQYH